MIVDLVISKNNVYMAVAAGWAGLTCSWPQGHESVGCRQLGIETIPSRCCLKHMWVAGGCIYVYVYIYIYIYLFLTYNYIRTYININKYIYIYIYIWKLISNTPWAEVRPCIFYVCVREIRMTTRSLCLLCLSWAEYDACRFSWAEDDLWSELYMESQCRNVTCRIDTDIGRVVNVCLESIRSLNKFQVRGKINVAG